MFQLVNFLPQRVRLITFAALVALVVLSAFLGADQTDW
jgi:hypothetical protein